MIKINDNFRSLTKDYNCTYQDHFRARKNTLPPSHIITLLPAPDFSAAIFAHDGPQAAGRRNDVEDSRLPKRSAEPAGPASRGHLREERRVPVPGPGSALLPGRLPAGRRGPPLRAAPRRYDTHHVPRRFRKMYAGRAV